MKDGRNIEMKEGECQGKSLNTNVMLTTMDQTKVTMIPGMSNVFQGEIKDKAEELRKVLKNFVFDQYIKGTISKLNRRDIKKIENDLGYIYFDIEDIEKSITLEEYEKLINIYNKQIKSVMKEK